MLSIKMAKPMGRNRKIKILSQTKMAFHKIKQILKYTRFEKRDGSIINKVIFQDKIIINQKEVNSHLKPAFQDLCGLDENCTFKRQSHFPRLPPLSFQQLKHLAEQLSKNKATCNDFDDDSSLFDFILAKKSSPYFTKLWYDNIINSRYFERHLTGRLIPLNKVHPSIPKPHEMRPIIAVSPLKKLLESRFKAKLDKYMEETMNKCQTDFVSGCGTHVNIIRLLEASLDFKNQNQRAAISFYRF